MPEPDPAQVLCPLRFYVCKSQRWDATMTFLCTMTMGYILFGTFFIDRVRYSLQPSFLHQVQAFTSVFNLLQKSCAVARVLRHPRVAFLGKALLQTQPVISWFVVPQDKSSNHSAHHFFSPGHGKLVRLWRSSSEFM
jgi:hypothetical protein